MDFQYETPDSINALSKLLDQFGPRGALLAGGTDLLVQLRARIVAPAMVIDIKQVPELSRIEHHEDGSVSIGASVSLSRIIDDAQLRKRCRALTQSCEQIATQAIRNRATIAGNIANASPCADSVPSLCVLSAKVELTSTEGTRQLSVPAFISGVRATVRKTNEFISKIHIPPHNASVRSFFRKLQRVRGHDLALANAAVMHDPHNKRLIVTIGSCSPVPVVVELDDLCESLDADEAAERCMKAILPISDVRASAQYRTDMTGVLVRRLFSDLKS